MSEDDALVAWRELFARVQAAQESPLYMPASLMVVLISLTIDRDGVVWFSDFEPLFESVMSVVHPTGADKAWEPFFHLSRSVGLWMLHDASGPADFADVPGGRPKGRGRLMGKVDRALIEPALRSALAVPERRAVVLSMLADELLASDDAQVRRLMVVAASLPEVVPGLLWRARLAIGSRSRP